ncbi:hypothetical protein VXQ16_01195 [Acinetobacter baumannii]|uniref:hypothetical protein n=1 Tax=Acinetobacter baumannii TaxID=470 RepID=UPI003A8AA3B2
MDKCREEFEKQKYWIGLFRDAVDFDEELGRYVLNGQRKLYAFHLDSFNEKWAIWQEAWQHQQAKVEELQTLYTQQGINMLKMQKRVDALELKLREIAGIARRARHGEYHTESGRNAGLNIAAEIEQALKGDQYDEHRKKAEEAISKGASLTNHRIEL